MIGLSTGAWAQVVANSPFVDRVTVVEINPGYLQLIRRYPQVASLLTNRKVNIVIDDGRRWLVHNRTRRFDLIVSNTTFHFRANSTNLLSAEFMKLVHARLRPSGVFYFNTTGSQDAMRTAFAEFPRGLRVANFIAVSDSTVALDSGRWLRLLTGYRIDGIPLLNLSLPAEQKVLETLSNFPGTVNGIPLQRGLETRESVLARIPTARVVTDDNMLPEWRTLLLDSREESNLRGRH
jgi:spermidine synthase